MRTPPSPAEAAAYLARWIEVGEREAAVTRAEPMALRLRQLCALFEARHLFPADAGRERESEIVRRRWQRLREALPVD